MSEGKGTTLSSSLLCGCITCITSGTLSWLLIWHRVTQYTPFQIYFQKPNIENSDNRLFLVLFWIHLFIPRKDTNSFYCSGQKTFNKRTREPWLWIWGGGGGARPSKSYFGWAMRQKAPHYPGGHLVLVLSKENEPHRRQPKISASLKSLRELWVVTVWI